MQLKKGLAHFKDKSNDGDYISVVLGGQLNTQIKYKKMYRIWDVTRIWNFVFRHFSCHITAMT